MTFLDAARKILAEAGVPLHFERITDLAFQQGLITSSGSTPAATMGSRLYTVTQDDQSEFTREGRGYFSLKSKAPKGIEQQIESINAATRDQLKSVLSRIDPKAFEALILDLLSALGFDDSTLKVGSYRNDGGIDVSGIYAATGLSHLKTAVQAKRWKNNVQRPQIQQLRGALTVDQRGIMITTSGFSPGAREEAAKDGASPIGLIDGEELLDLLFKHGVGVKKQMHPVFQLDDERWRQIQGEMNHDTEPSPEPETARGNAKVGTPRQGRKLTSVSVLGNVYPVTQWKEGLIRVVIELYGYDAQLFEQSIVGMGGKKRTYVGKTPDQMHTPTKVPNLPLYVETNQSSTTAKALADSMVTRMGLGEQTVEWILSED